MRSGWMGEGMDNWQTSELKTGLDECKGKAGRSGSRVDGKVMTTWAQTSKRTCGETMEQKLGT
jgi:hypothetical protein